MTYIQHGRRHSPTGSDPIPGLQGNVGVATETLMLASTASGGITSVGVLASGQEYILTVQGTYSLWNSALEKGTPEADAMYPTVGSRSSTQVGVDAECCFAYHDIGTGFTTGHVSIFEMDLGSGFTHIDPQDGQHTTPVTRHLYTYKVIGQGSAVTFKINDTGSYSDNYGYLKIVIQSADPASGGSDGSGAGTGTLVPPATTNNSILRLLSGVAAWAAQPDIAEADLNLTDVTTANVSTSKHGLAPKAPNDATKYLDGTGAYSVPPVPTTVTADNQTGTTYTLALGDAGDVVELNNASAITLTIPTNASVAFPVGTVIELWQQGAGQVTVAAAVGVTLRSPSSKVKLSAQYASAVLRKRATDEWALEGNLA